jgi:hypothetical protein
MGLGDCLIFSGGIYRRLFTLAFLLAFSTPLSRAWAIQCDQAAIALHFDWGVPLTHTAKAETPEDVYHALAAHAGEIELRWLGAHNRLRQAEKKLESARNEEERAAARKDRDGALRERRQAYDEMMALPPDFTKNSFVTTELTDRQWQDVKAIQAQTRNIEARVAETTAARARDTAEREALESRREVARREGRDLSPAELERLAELKESGRYDYVVVGRGHTAVITVREILKRDPNAKILIAGEEQNFWGDIHYAISVVGEVGNFFSARRGDVHVDAQGKIVKPPAGTPMDYEAYLRESDPPEQRAGQYKGFGIGKYINDNFEDFITNYPNITVVQGEYRGTEQKAGKGLKHDFHSQDGAKVAVDVPLDGRVRTFFNVGLGKPMQIRVKDAAGKPIDPNSIKDHKGRVRAPDNLVAQRMVQAGIERGNPVGDMLAEDAQPGKDTTYLISGRGDGAFSVLEGLLEGTFRRCCQVKGETFEQFLDRVVDGTAGNRGQQMQKFLDSMGNLKIKWIGTDMLENGWVASMSIPRYAKIRKIVIAMMEARPPRMELIDSFMSEPVWHPETNSFRVDLIDPVTKQTLQTLPEVSRIFHNNGNQGSFDMLKRLYSTAYGPTAANSNPPANQNELIHRMNMLPVYAPEPLPDGTKQIVGMKVFGPDPKPGDEPLAVIGGNAGLLLAYSYGEGATRTGPPPMLAGRTPKAVEEWTDFLTAYGALKEQTLSLAHWQRADGRPGPADRESGPYPHYINPFGVRRTQQGAEKTIASVLPNSLFDAPVPRSTSGAARRP